MRLSAVLRGIARFVRGVRSVAGIVFGRQRIYECVIRESRRCEHFGLLCRNGGIRAVEKYPQSVYAERSGYLIENVGYRLSGFVGAAVFFAHVDRKKVGVA